MFQFHIYFHSFQDQDLVQEQVKLIVSTLVVGIVVHDVALSGIAVAIISFILLSAIAIAYIIRSVYKQTLFVDPAPNSSMVASVLPSASPLQGQLPCRRFRGKPCVYSLVSCVVACLLHSSLSTGHHFV